MRISRRSLPEADSSLDEISESDRAVLAQVWQGRAAAELTGSLNFGVISAALKASDAEPALLTLADRAIEDELWHARICHRMASIYRGAEAPEPQPDTFCVPPHEGASEQLRGTLHVLGQCCFNETTGSAFYERCFSLARSAFARSAMRALLSDEIDHARIGWAHLASPRVASSQRTAIQNWLPVLAEANLNSWRRRVRLPARPALTHNGCPSFEEGDDAVVGALHDLIVPGLARFGYDVTEVLRRVPSRTD